MRGRLQLAVVASAVLVAGCGDIPRDPEGSLDRVPLDLADTERLHDAVRRVNWKLHDVVIVPVRELPVGNLSPGPEELAAS